MRTAFLSLAAMMLLFLAALSPLPAAAQSDDPALAPHLDALDSRDFAAKGRAVEAIAQLDDPFVVPLLRTLGAGDLYRRKSDGLFFRAERDGRDYKLFDLRSGDLVETLSGSAVTRIIVNNSMRGQIDALLGSLTLRADDPAQRLAAARTIFEERDPATLPALESAIAGGGRRRYPRVDGDGARGDPGRRRRGADRKPAGGRLGAARHGRARGDGYPQGRIGRRSTRDRRGRRRGRRRDRADDAALGPRPECLVRALPRLGVVAGGDRARHHLRGDGGHQHGAWRACHARRLHDLRRAGGDPRRGLLAFRLLAADRRAARLRRGRSRRRRDRAGGGTVPLWPAAGNIARHLGHQPDPATGGTLGLRSDQQGGRQSPPG